MLQQNILLSLFVAFAFISQGLLILNFAALKWRPHVQRKWGWIVYASGLISLALGILFWVSGRAWYLGFACGLFTIWTMFGYIIDVLQPIEWRKPIRWLIFIPYVILYISAQFAFWIPLWFIRPGYWFIYAVLYTISTVLNVSTHLRANKGTCQ
jgi:hypothetical protein